MKISICDVCNKDNKIVKAGYRIGFRGGAKLDACNDHKDFAKGKTPEQMMKDVWG